MQSKPMGAARGRYVEITTKSGNSISGTLVRIEDDIVYLAFDFVREDAIAEATSTLPERVTATVSLCDVDTLLIGDRNKRDKDDANADDTVE